MAKAARVLTAGAEGALESGASILSVRNLVVEFRQRNSLIRAVEDVSLEVRRGESLGIVGESGCGKTTLARAILRLIPSQRGQIHFDGADVTNVSRSTLRGFRRNMQIVFQDPSGSLNPRMKVGEIVAEPLVAMRIGSRRDQARRVAELLGRVGLGESSASKYPREFSGGQKQRIGIARALAPSPKLLVLDEPVSALDVSIQAQIVNLLADLRTELGLTYVFISHDLSVVRHFCDRVAVMYLGKIVELAEVSSLFEHTRHPFTQTLLSSVPSPDPGIGTPGIKLVGEPPSPIDRPGGCSFHPRCRFSSEICWGEVPELIGCGTVGNSHRVACYHPLGD